MKHSLLTLALWLVTVCAMAQIKVSGRVIDAQTLEPLYGANVILEQTNKGATTSLEGAFELNNLRSGTYQLRITYVGYETYRQSLTLTESTELSISLERSSLLTEEFIVTATRANENTPTTYTNVKREDIQKINLGQDLPILLNQTPSVVTNSDAGAGVGYTGIRIRGSDQTRINVTINGIPVNDAESHGVFWVNMPDFASSVDNIQIQRGVGTSTNGAAAFGASINVQTNTLREEPYAEFNNSFGSFNTWKHTVSAGTGLLNDRFVVDARLSQITSDGFIDRAFSDLSSYFLSGAYYGDKHIIKLNIFSGREQTYQAWNGVPESLLRTNRTFNAYTYENETDNYQQDNYQLIYTGTLSPTIKANLALHYTYGRGYYEQFRTDDDFADYNLPNVVIGGETITSTDLIRRRWLDNDFYGAVYSLNYLSTDEKVDITLGGGANRYDGDHFGEVIWARFASTSDIRYRYYDNNAVKDDVNFFLKANYQLTPKLNVFGDMQVRMIDYRFLGFDNNLSNVTQDANYTFYNPKFGATYALGAQQSIYASYAISNREPVRDDFTESSPDSRPLPERLRNLEVGYRQNGERYNLEVAYYLMDYQNQLILTGQINDVGAYTRQNVDNSYRTGIELVGGYRFSDRLQWTGNVTYSQNMIRNFVAFYDDFDTGEQFTEAFDGETPIAFSPDWVAGSTFSFKPYTGFTADLLTKYVSEQYLDNTGNSNRQLDAFLTNDLRLNYQFKAKFAKEISLTLLVNNMFDVEYEPNGYTFSYVAGGEFITENFYYPMAGRNFLLGLNVRF